MNTLEILRAARKLITSRKRWTKGAGARDAHGFSTPVTSERAVCWCTSGALGRVDQFGAIDALTALDDLTPRRDAVQYNDTRSHRSVLRLFDRAIAKLEAEV